MQLSNRAAAELNLTGPITFTAGQGSRDRPRSILRPPGRQKPPPAEANLPAGDDARTPGPHDGVPFTLSFPGGGRRPAGHVRARHRLGQVRRPGREQTVHPEARAGRPPRFPPQTLRDYDVTVTVPDGTVGGIHVTGPPDQIHKLQERDDAPGAADPDLPIPIAVLAVGARRRDREPDREADRHPAPAPRRDRRPARPRPNRQVQHRPPQPPPAGRERRPPIGPTLTRSYRSVFPCCGCGCAGQVRLFAVSRRAHPPDRRPANGGTEFDWGGHSRLRSPSF